MLRNLTGKPLCQSLKKLWYTNASLRRNPNADWFILFISVDTRFKIIQHIDFIHHQQGRDLVRVDLFENRIHSLNIFLHTEICRINNVQQQCRLTRLLQGGFKRRHQVVRQMTDKPDGIRQHSFTDICYVYTT